MKTEIKETFDPAKAAKAQNDLVKEKSYPQFAPISGICYRCKNNIYKQVQQAGYFTGISLERAGSELITGCPHCSRSYCD